MLNSCVQSLKYLWQVQAHHLLTLCVATSQQQQTSSELCPTYFFPFHLIACMSMSCTLMWKMHWLVQDLCPLEPQDASCCGETTITLINGNVILPLAMFWLWKAAHSNTGHTVSQRCCAYLSHASILLFVKWCSQRIKVACRSWTVAYKHIRIIKSL